MSRKGSLIHQIITKAPGLQAGCSKASKNTIVQHRNNAIKFAKWCKEHLGCRDYEDITNNIVDNLNAYSTWLERNGKTASTIHTYVAGCCAAWKIPMTSNYNSSKLITRLTPRDGDSVTASAIVDRLYEMCRLIVLAGESWRCR